MREWDPGSLGQGVDPYRQLAALRDEAPVLRLDCGFVAVTGHAAALTALTHPDCGSAPIGAGYRDRLPPGAARDEMANRINFLDPPDHPRVRRLVSGAFTPRRIEALRPWMRATADDLLDRVTDLGADGHPVDLLADYAHQLPSLVISELLGVPPADRDRLTAWSDAVTPLLGLGPSSEELAGAIDAAERFHAYLDDLLEDRRRHPGDDLLSALVQAEEDGERLRPVELRSLAATLYSAGHRTTRDSLANGVSVLLADPDRWRSVADGTFGTAEVVAELLRLETPTLFVARVARADLELAGVEVGAGTPVLVYLAGANRDPEVYRDPDAFAPGRDGPAALSFAFGAHYCLGASLARAEAETMLGELAARFPGLRSTGEPPSFQQRGPFRGVDALPVLLT